MHHGGGKFSIRLENTKLCDVIKIWESYEGTLMTSHNFESLQYFSGKTPPWSLIPHSGVGNFGVIFTPKKSNSIKYFWGDACALPAPSSFALSIKVFFIVSLT